MIELNGISRSFGDRQVLGLARTVDILKKSEAIDAKFQATTFEKFPETLHEQAQYLVHIHEQQGPAGIQAHISEVWSPDGGGLGRVGQFGTPERD